MNCREPASQVCVCVFLVLCKALLQRMEAFAGIGGVLMPRRAV